MQDLKNQKIAIIGAGVSGLAAAWALKDSDWEVSVFEKSRGPSGRAATRTINGVRVDHGANYFKLNSPDLEELVLRELPSQDLIQIPGEVYLFDENSELLRGDPLLNSEAKWNYKNGISELGKRIAACSGVKIIKETRVTSLEEISNGEWELTSADGNSLGVYDAVLFTPPAPMIAIF